MENNNKIADARNFLKRVEPLSDEEVMMKKIRMVLIRQFLEDTRTRLKDRK